MGVRQAIFAPSLENLSRMPDSRQTPSRFGPSHCGQSSVGSWLGAAEDATSSEETIASAPTKKSARSDDAIRCMANSPGEEECDGPLPSGYSSPPTPGNPEWTRLRKLS